VTAALHTTFAEAGERYRVTRDPDNRGSWLVYDRRLTKIFAGPCSRSDADRLAAHMEEIHVRSQRQIEEEEHA
jgi:hypothetical protein